MKSMQNNNNSNCYYTKTKPRKEKRLCEHCGMNHVISEKYGCFGKAMADGRLTEQEVQAIFNKVPDPAAAVRRMKEFYATHQAKLKGTEVTTKPVRTVNFMVNTSKQQSRTDVLKVDTQAEDTILNDAAHRSFWLATTTAPATSNVSVWGA